MTTKEAIEVMQAFENGKEVEWRLKTETDENYSEWERVYSPSWNWDNCDYCIKEEPKYRPYKDTEEMINDFCERFGVKRTNFSEPFIWVKDSDGDKSLITSFSETDIGIYGYGRDLEEFLNDYTYLDGSPCGIKEKNS